MKRFKKEVIPFDLDQFEEVIYRIKAEYSFGNMDLIGLFEIETLEYYYNKAKENEEKCKN